MKIKKAIRYLPHNYFIEQVTKHAIFIYKKITKNNLATNAKAAILIKINSQNHIIFQKKINKKLHPASLTKLLNMLVVLSKIDNGLINWSDKIKISQTAASTHGSTIRLKRGEMYSVEDLFKAMIIASGNDAAVALAEYISGSVNGYVEEMNKMAKELGLKKSHFNNPHGLSNKNHYSTVFDIVKMSQEVLKRDEVLKLAKQKSCKIINENNKIKKLKNTNKLIGAIAEIDGLKTGSTPKAGHCISVTAQKGKSRLIAVLMGEPDEKNRDIDAVSLISYGLSIIDNEAGD